MTHPTGKPVGRRKVFLDNPGVFLDQGQRIPNLARASAYFADANNCRPSDIISPMVAIAIIPYFSKLV
jgi:hypothetical protein